MTTTQFGRPQAAVDSQAGGGTPSPLPALICSACFAPHAHWHVIVLSEGHECVLTVCGRCMWRFPLRGLDEHNRRVVRHEAIERDYSDWTPGELMEAFGR
jgi:hypothetical protein